MSRFFLPAIPPVPPPSRPRIGGSAHARQAGIATTATSTAEDVDSRGEGSRGFEKAATDLVDGNREEIAMARRKENQEDFVLPTFLFPGVSLGTSLIR